MENLRQQIELWLLAQRDWVPAAEICQRFGVRERRLRQNGEHPGLLSDFAISSDHGFKHIHNAEDKEYFPSRARLCSHIKNEARRVRAWDSRRKNERQGIRPFLVEKFTGQTLLPV